MMIATISIEGKTLKTSADGWHVGFCSNHCGHMVMHWLDQWSMVGWCDSCEDWSYAR